MTDDSELLCRYVDDRSEEAFAELVRRHVDLVYSSALRQAWGDHHRAQEITQMVFIDLARKAGVLVRHPVLPAWLHRSGHLVALELRRKEGRRQKYERAAAAETPIAAQDGATAVWEEVRPVLDDVLNRLDERDRQAILLRYFANRPFGEIGERLRLTENAARMRVERALEKLHALLEKRGIKSSSAALAAALSSQAIAAAPVGAAAASTAAAMAVTGGAGLGWIALMSTAKLPATLTAAVLAFGATVIVLQERSATRTAAAIADLARQNRSIPALREANQHLAASAEQARDLAGEDASVSILRGQLKEAEAKAGAAAIQPKPKRVAKLDDGQPVMDISKLDQLPIMVTQNRPEYPVSMRQANADGQAVVRFVVGSDGLVYNANAITFTDPEFAESAVQAVSQWVFKPGQVAGQNVYTQMDVPIVFTLSQEDATQTGSKPWF
jgi:RNA polymerase sigma factor (sigma-70 family)